MTNTLKISLGILFVAIIAFIGVYAKFNLQNNNISEKHQPIIVDQKETNESIDELYNSNQLDKIIEKTKNFNDLQSLILLANAYLQKGSLEFKEEEYGKKGLEVANKILEIDPENTTGLNLKGYAYEIMENYPEALKAYKASLKLKISAQTLNQIGHVYDLMGDDKNSRKYYAMAAKLSPKDTNIVMNLARVDYDDEKLNKALEEFKYVYNNELNARRKAEAAYMISQIYLSNDLFDIKKAEEYALASTKADPNFPMAWVGLGKIYFANALTGEDISEDEYISLIKKASDNYEKAIKLNPNQTSAYFELAQLAVVARDVKIAEEMYKKALDAVDKDISLMNNDREEYKKYIEEEMRYNIDSLKKNDGPVSSVLKKIVVGVTFPSTVKAACVNIAHGRMVCSSRAEALYYVRMRSQGSAYCSRRPRHCWTWRGSYAVCNNGAILTWNKPAVCGNGKRENGEQCDDGNKYSKDGCSSSCRIEDGKCGAKYGECEMGLVELKEGTKTEYKWNCKAILKGGEDDSCSAVRPYCGDNNKNQPTEECDKGVMNGRLGSGCSSECKIVDSEVYYCPPPKENISYNGTLEDYRNKCGTPQGECGNNIKQEGEECDFTGKRTINGKEYFCTSECKLKSSDDVTYPPVDDPTTYCKKHPQDLACKTKPTGDLDIKLFWSIDRNRWSDNFDDLIQLRSKNSQIYLKSVTTKGECKSQLGQVSLYTFNFLDTADRTTNYLQKKSVTNYGGGIMYTTSPTSTAPVATVFDQNLKINYCNNAVQKDKVLHVKIVNLKEEEI